ncbi:MAG: hypothetical protein IK079_04660 [Desulfovibrio sp.]|nr:hypothetical protein [Desulfovibrio sp.]
MLEQAAMSTYKDLMSALGKLVEWSEQAGKGSVPSGPPSADLVQQFSEALGANIPATEDLSVQAGDQGAASTRLAPKDLIANSDLFQSGEMPVNATDGADVSDMPPFGQPQRLKESMTMSQEVNLNRGMQAIDEVNRANETDFFQSAQKLSEILSQSASEFSPMDLLQAQRLIGFLRIHAESGQKLSEGVGETLEQLLEQQG